MVRIISFYFILWLFFGLTKWYNGGKEINVEKTTELLVSQFGMDIDIAFWEGGKVSTIVHPFFQPISFLFGTRERNRYDEVV